MDTSFHKRFQSLLSNSTSLAFQGSGSSKALLSSYVQRFAQNPIVILTSSFHRMEQWKEDFSFFSAKQPFLFPHWDTVFYDNFSPNQEIIAQRFNALHTLLYQPHPIVITTPHALLQKLLPKAIFSESSLSLEEDQNISLDSLISHCQSIGYQLVDQVEEQGEMSLHNQVFDLFPIQSSTPYRIYTDQSTILQISPFSVQTQNTEEIATASIRIIPAREIVYTPAVVHDAQKRLLPWKSKVSTEIYQQIFSHISSQTHFAGMESLLGLFYATPDSFFEYIPHNTIFLIDDEQEVQKLTQFIYEEVFAEYELSLQQGNLTLSPEITFFNPSELFEKISQFQKINISESTPVFNSSEWGSFVVHSSLSNNPHHSSHLALEQIQTWREQSPLALTARNLTHAEHLQQMFQHANLQTALIEQPIFAEILEQQDWFNHSLFSTQSPIPIFIGTPSSGFQWIDPQGHPLFILITEDEVVGEKTKSRALGRSNSKRLLGSLDDLQAGDYVVHLDYGIGKYAGLQKISTHDVQSDFMLITYSQGGKVYVPIEKFNLIQKYVNADGSPPKLNKLGDKHWKKTRQKVEKAIEDIAEDLLEIYASRKVRKGFEYPVDDELTHQFDLEFPYEETSDQLQTIEDVKSDMQSPLPMDRLICGDVGFGKTEIAMRAAFKAINSGKQVGLLVPTTILAQQHFLSFVKRFQNFPIVIDVISRFRTPTEQKKIMMQLKEGAIDMIIGTHRLLSLDVAFQDLGLLIIDEEQRFGVKHKERMKQFRKQVDVLALSATPIPRTLYMSLMGIRDLSVINTPPADRLAIRTRIFKSSDYVIQEAVQREIRRGGQVFFVHNEVETIYQYGNYLQSILPKVRIGVAHGQLNETQLEKIMLAFIAGEYDVLLSTTIIESGLDIPRANTILIHRAERFGLSQLYQLRGRVGRSHQQAYAYLLIPADKMLSEIAHQRLKTLQELNDLGTGYKIAARDLELRGAGNILGTEQSGHISSIGFELYTQLLENKIRKLQNQPYSSYEDSLRIHLNIDVSIPENYISSTNQRLNLYQQLASVQTEEELWRIRDSVENRFNTPPPSVRNLFHSTHLRIIGHLLGLQSIDHSNNELTVQFNQTDHLDSEQLIQWITTPNSKVQFIPENTLKFNDISNDIPQITEALQSIQRLASNPANPQIKS